MKKVKNGNEKCIVVYSAMDDCVKDQVFNMRERLRLQSSNKVINVGKAV